MNKKEFDVLSLDKSYCLPLNYSTNLKKNDTFEELGAIYFNYCTVGVHPGCIDLNNNTNL